MREVRKIRPEELLEHTRVVHVAFGAMLSASRTAEVLMKECTETESRDAKAWQNRYGVFEDGRMIAGLSFIPYPVRYHGNTVTMVGVGNVATLPPYRGQGAVKDGFRQGLSDLHEQGVLLSGLFPFKESFYRKMGYEVCLYSNVWKLRLDAIRPIRVEGKAELIEKGDDITPLLEVYQAMAQHYDLSTVREAVDYGFYQTLDPYDARQYTYLWRNAAGEPKGYLSYRRENNGDEALMDCSVGSSAMGFYFADEEGLFGLLSFVRGFTANHTHIRFALPARLDLTAMVTETGGISCYRRYTGMLRAVDVEGLLRKTRCRRDGRFVLSVTDPLAPWNEGLLELTCKTGECVQVCRLTEGKPDVEMTVRTFTRLLVSGMPAALEEGLKVHTPDLPLDGVFYPHDTWFTENF